MSDIDFSFKKYNPMTLIANGAWTFANTLQAVLEASKPFLPSLDGMVKIPSGTFEMGSNDYYTDEGPAHKVTITRDYYLDETEVTNAEYEHVMGKSPSPKGFDGPDQPVVLVSWKDADAYCRAINKRLPTEAEWENAATVGGTYSFGSRSGEEEILEEEVCFKKGRQKGETCNVKDYPPNELGLYGMSGNVWEWVSDWHDFYPLGHVVDPKGPQAGEHKMLRGVSYCYINSWDLRATKRSADNPNNYSRDAGFRCAW